MRHSIKIPRLGEITEDVLILKILVKVGDRVGSGQPLLLVETDKAEVEIPSPVGGQVVEILIGESEEVSVGKTVMVVEA